LPDNEGVLLSIDGRGGLLGVDVAGQGTEGEVVGAHGGVGLALGAEVAREPTVQVF
jgi:hypothetical protein